MIRPFAIVAILTGGVSFTLPERAFAQQSQRSGGSNRSDPFGGYGGNSKDPIRIDANKLEVFDKENKAIYSGDVIAVRGTAVTRSTVMTIFYESRRNEQGRSTAAPSNPAPANPAPANPAQAKPANASGGAGGQDGALKRIEFTGPVSVVNGTQTMTSNTMVYDAQSKVVTLRGNATVADGPNIQRGEHMTYNTETGVATIITPGGRVQGVFTPGSANEGQDKNQGQDKKKRNNGGPPTN